jgi:CRP-like cAMP-binding protein
VARVKEVRVDKDLMREGERPNESTLLLEGFAARYKLLRNGRRQITALHIPGDFVDLHSLVRRRGESPERQFDWRGRARGV